MSAIKENLVISQGCDFIYELPLEDDSQNKLDVTGCNANAGFKKYYTAANVSAFAITLANGSLTFAMNAANTAVLAAGRYVYDVVFSYANNYTIRLMEGIVTVSPGVIEPGINTDDELLTG